MTITITITADMIGLLCLYLLVGALLFVPLNHWAAGFISPRRRGWDVWRNVRPRRLILSFFGCLVAWPQFLAMLIKDEWKRWRRKRCKGCCSTCDGTGGSMDPETNGRCWDCRGTGHQHWV